MSKAAELNELLNSVRDAHSKGAEGLHERIGEIIASCSLADDIGDAEKRLDELIDDCRALMLRCRNYGMGEVGSIAERLSAMRGAEVVHFALRKNGVDTRPLEHGDDSGKYLRRLQWRRTRLIHSLALSHLVALEDNGRNEVEQLFDSLLAAIIDKANGISSKGLTP